MLIRRLIGARGGLSRGLAAVSTPQPGPPESSSGSDHGGVGGADEDKDKDDEELEEEVGAPLSARVPNVEHPLDGANMVHPSAVPQEGHATTVPKGEPNTMAAPENQGGG
jgi:hypothetical protein